MNITVRYLDSVFQTQTRIISAQRIGRFAVHRSVELHGEGPGWTVTHAESGIAVLTSLVDKETAIAVARASEIPEWDLFDASRVKFRKRSRRATLRSIPKDLSIAMGKILAPFMAKRIPAFTKVFAEPKRKRKIR